MGAVPPESELALFGILVASACGPAIMADFDETPEPEPAASTSGVHGLPESSSGMDDAAGDESTAEVPPPACPDFEVVLGAAEPIWNIVMDDVGGFVDVDRAPSGDLWAAGASTASDGSALVARVTASGELVDLATLEGSPAVALAARDSGEGPLVVRRLPAWDEDAVEAMSSTFDVQWSWTLEGEFDAVATAGDEVCAAGTHDSGIRYQFFEADGMPGNVGGAAGIVAHERVRSLRWDAGGSLYALYELADATAQIWNLLTGAVVFVEPVGALEPRDLVVLAETHLVAGSLDERPWVGEVDREGEILWSSTLGLEEIADTGRVERIARRADDSFVALVSHVQRAVPHDYHHGWLGRFDAQGTVLDAIEIHGEWGTRERDFGLVVLEDDDVVVAGRVRCGDDERPYLGRFRF